MNDSFKAYGLLILSVFLTSPAAQATLTIESVANASAYDAGSGIIYGGSAGSNASCGAATGLCNNCVAPAAPADGGLLACNKVRITPTTELSVTMKSDAVAGFPMIAKASDGSQVGIYPTSIAKGEAGTLTVAWSNLCNTITDGDASCETDGALDLNKGLAFRIGFSVANDSTLADGDDYKTISVQVQRTLEGTVPLTGGTSALGSNGIYDFSIFPGDSKVYLEDLAAHANFPVSANGVLYSKVHLLSAKNVGACANDLFSNSDLNDAEKFKTVTLDGSDLSEDRFFGYENEVSYMFKVALEDRAGNIGLFTSDADCVTAKHVKAPGEVFGLLRERQNCFIATAAYGSQMAPAVGTFRQFRDRFLIKSALGRRFVSAYYSWSPKVASQIADNETYKMMSRIALYPLWIFAALSLNYGFLAAVIAFSFLILIPMAIFHGLRKGINT